MRVFNRAIKLAGENKKVGDIVTRVLTVDRNNDALLVTGITVPTGRKYAHGCMFVKTDAGAGVKSLYENQGTNVTADFNLIGEATPGEIALAEGSILVGNASGVGAAVVAKTLGRILVGDGTTTALVAVSGDATLASSGALTIANDAVTTAKILNANVTFAKLPAVAAGQIAVGNAGGTALAAVALSGDATLAATGALTIANGAIITAKILDSNVTEAKLAASSAFGLGVLRTARAKYDFAADGGAQGAITLATTATLPDNAVIVGATLNSTTAATSGGAATIAVGTTAGSAANSIKTAEAVGSFSADALINGTVTFAAPVKMTAAGNINITVATADLTAGVIEITLLYFVAAA